MTHEFEKYFPLPLTYDAVRGEIKTYGGIVVMQPSLGLMSNEQAEYADDFARHLTACANLMPEAVELINTLRKELCFFALYLVTRANPSARDGRRWKHWKKRKPSSPSSKGAAGNDSPH